MQKRYLLTFLVIFVAFLSFLYFTRAKKDTFTFWTIQLKPVATEFIEKNILEFKEKHQDVEVVWVDIPIAEAQKRALASILGGNPPDLINLNPDFSILLAKVGALEFFDEPQSDFVPEIENSLKYEGKIYALPFYATSAVTIYNKKCLKTPPKTYDDILNLETKCQNVFAINLNENDTMARILNKYDIYDENDKKIDEVFLKFKKMYDTKKIPADSLVINHREVVEKFMADDTGAIVAGANFVKMVRENAKNVYENSDVAPQITQNGKFDVSLMNFVVPARAKNKAYAKEFLAQILDTKSQIEFAKLTNVLAVNQNALKDDFFTCPKNAELTDLARCYGALQLQKMNTKTFDTKNKKELSDKINTRLEEFLLK